MAHVAQLRFRPEPINQKEHDVDLLPQGAESNSLVDEHSSIRTDSAPSLFGLCVFENLDLNMSTAWAVGNMPTTGEISQKEGRKGTTIIRLS
jgi:hypothetical protein